MTQMPEKSAPSGWIIGVVLVVLVAMQLAPIWAFKYVPTADGPAHVENCYIIRNYHRPNFGLFREFFVLRNAPDPNLGGHLMMTALMYVVPPLLAEKILLSFYVILMPVAFGYALKQINPRAWTMAVLILPFTFTYTFQMGFYNFSMGIVAFFFAAGYWLKHRDKFGILQAIVLGLLILVAYSCHMIPMMLAIVFIAGVGSWLTLCDIWTKKSSGEEFVSVTPEIERNSTNLALSYARKELKSDRGLVERMAEFCIALWNRLLIPMIAAAPTLLLWAWFMYNAKKNALLPAKAFDAGRLEQLLRVFSFTYFPAFTDWEHHVFQALGALMALAGIILLSKKVNYRTLNRWDGLLFVAAAFGVLFLTQGTQFFLAFRLNLFIVLAAALWLGIAASEETWLRRLLQIGGSVAAALFAVNCFIAYQKLNPQVDEFVSVAPKIERNSTLLTLSYARKGWKPDGGNLVEDVVPFLYTAGYIAAERDVVDLTNYEANTGYFPVGFNPKLNPYDYKGPRLATSKIGLDVVPPNVDIAGYEQRTGKTVDYVLLWGSDAQLALPDASGKPIASQLDGAYDLIFTSEANHLARLYKRKPQ